MNAIHTTAEKQPETGFTHRLRELQVILKVAERCNLACSYCYYFYGGDESYMSRAPIMKSDVMRQVTEYLCEAVSSLGIAKVSVILHGGEPTLMRPRDFRTFANDLKDRLKDRCELRFGIQTNGYHLSKEWIDAFIDYKVDVGISIDGPREYHDKYRITKSGKESFDQIKDNVAKLHRLSDEEKIKPVGSLTVINHQMDADMLFDTLVNELGFASIGLLLPDHDADYEFTDSEHPETYGLLMIALFERWIERQDIHLREIARVLSFFKERGNIPLNKYLQDNQVIVIQSDGTIAIDDSLIPALKSERELGLSIYSSALEHFLDHKKVRALESARRHLPDICMVCKWRNICGGGSLENRYRESNGFNNPSLYCEAIKIFLEFVVKFLVDNGYPNWKVDEVLDLTREHVPTFLI